MCCKGFTKRILPFFLTFAVGLFIASFFVSIAAPSFQFPNRGSKRKHREEDIQRDLEIQRLREENLRLKSQQSDWENADYQNLNLKYVPPVPPMPPAPPAPPSLKNVPRYER